MEQDFTGKVALITGSSGIGLASALRLAQGGAQVHLCGNDPALNAQAVTACAGQSINVHEVDVAQEDQVAGVVDVAVAQNGGLDIVVNAAAIQTYGDVVSTDIAHWDRVMNVNLRACFLTSHFAVPHMKKRGGGAIVHLASVQGHANQYGVLAYATTKGALHTLTRAMAVDCAKDNIRVNSVSPGSIHTPLLEISARHFLKEGESVEDAIKGFGAAHPVGRVGTPEEVAELIAFLCSDKASFCTGGDYRVDGGLLCLIGA